MSEWIDAKEKMPEDAELIFAFSDSNYPHYFYGMFDDNWLGVDWTPELGAEEGLTEEEWNCNRYRFWIANGNGKKFYWDEIDLWMHIPDVGEKFS